jgi:hypothetical protein
METLEHVKQLIALVRKGSFLEAIERFYAEGATMQENLDSPRAGLPALLNNERRVLATLPDIHLERRMVHRQWGSGGDQLGVRLHHSRRSQGTAG